MKKLFLYFIGALVLLSSCSKDEDTVFDKSPDQRLRETLDKYQAVLLSSPNGWKASIVPENGATFNFFFRFNDQNRVVMFSDWDTTTASTAGESSYRLKALQQPSLIFDTYSYLHLLADPDPNVNGGLAGQGFQTDFEFNIDTATDNQVLLTGRLHSTKMTLTKATAQEASAWENKLWANGMALLNVDNIPVYFKRLTIGNQQYDVQIDPFGRTITFLWTDGSGNAQAFTTSFSFSPDGITFSQPFNPGSGAINGFTNISWDEATSTVNLQVNNTAAVIRGSGSPAAVDVNAPRRWWQTAAAQGGYWASFGFTVNGVFDAYRVTSVSNFIVYWPEIGTSGGIAFDLFGFVEGNSVNYGPAYNPPTFTTDGRIIFTHIGTLGTVPANATSIVNNIVTQMAEPSGYYLVQTSATTYDMVSAKDAKSWITWILP